MATVEAEASGAERSELENADPYRRFNGLKAITRGVSRRIGDCELTCKPREEINYQNAVSQLKQYRQALSQHGVEVVSLLGDDSFPDCCFIQDTAIVLDDVCIIASMGTDSRRGETLEVEKLLSEYRSIERILLPATIDGGDVVQFGKTLFVGLSRRTNAAGIEAFARLAESFHYEVIPVTVKGGLHLSTACGVVNVNEQTVLLNPNWVDVAPFRNMRTLWVPEEESWAANTISLDGTICLEAGAPRTVEMVQPYIKDIEIIDISEFRKAEGSLSCLSIIFRDSPKTEDNALTKV